MEFFFPGRRSYAQAHQGVMALYTCLDSKAYRKGGDKSFIVDFFFAENDTRRFQHIASRIESVAGIITCALLLVCLSSHKVKSWIDGSYDVCMLC